MQFEAKFYKNRLTVVNPAGHVGLVTLWSKVDSVQRALSEVGVDFDRATSKVAVIANLYGNGLPQMLRNLLYNPQIDELVVFGSNASGSREWLKNFFELGVENSVSLGIPVLKIKGTDRVVDEAVRPEHFLHPPRVTVFGREVGNVDQQRAVKEFLDNLPAQSITELVRQDPPPIPVVEIKQFPSDGHGILIKRPTVMEAWRELVFQLHRNGRRNKVAKSTGTEERIELLNAQVVVGRPFEESVEILAEYGFDLERFRNYQHDILNPVKPEDKKYTYGHLLRTGLGGESVDSLEIMAQRMKKDIDSRNAYATLWNNSVHLPSGSSGPCLVTLFFRHFDGALSLTATFRVHNALDGWSENMYGLMAIQKYVADVAGAKVGPITAISHSISIDPIGMDRVLRVVNAKTSDGVLDFETNKVGLQFDPNGEFAVSFDPETWEIIATHSYKGVPLGEYRGRNAETVRQQIARDGAVSVLSHAMYLGSELTKQEFAMKSARSKVI